MEISTNRKVYWSVLSGVVVTPIIASLWKYLQKRKDADEILEKQLKSALNALEDSDSEDDEDEPTRDFSVSAGTSLHCTGVITTLEIEFGLIDEKFYFKTRGVKKFKVGDRVSFVVFNDGEKDIVKNVQPVLNDAWDDSGMDTVVDKLVENLTIDREAQVLKRNIVGQVTERHARYVLVTPPNVTCNLDEIQSEFIPMVGDWVILETLGEVDESVSDLSGKIIYGLRNKVIAYIYLTFLFYLTKYPFLTI